MKTITERKLLWLFGALERLAGFGFIGSTPYKISDDSIDLFLELDEHRNLLFPDETELKIILKYILEDANGVEIDEKTLSDFYSLVIDYKNNRERMVKYYLESTLSS